MAVLRARLAELRAPGPALLWAGGAGALWLLYALVFLETGASSSVGDALVDAAANVAPLALLSAGVWAALRAYVMPRGVAVQAAAHVVLAVAFAAFWYAGVLLMLAVSSGWRGQGYAITGFGGPALTWQVFQGLVIYALVAATCYAIRGGREAAAVTFVEAPRPMERFLARVGDSVRPVEVRDIASITGAQDYTEVRTAGGQTLLVRLSLAEWEARLDASAFVRVHRSAIIALAHLERAEGVGGGRMVARMRGGDSVEVSRAGAQALRSLVV